MNTAEADYNKGKMKQRNGIKKIISFLLILSILTSLVTACGKDSDSKDDGTTASTEDLEFDLSEYAGDIDTLVYALISNEYSTAYDVFDAYVTLKDGTYIFGLGYTDYDQYYEADDGTGYFPAGFLCEIGGESIPEDEEEAGVIIYDADCDEEKSQYVYAYSCEPFMRHCVVWDTYLQYGVDQNGVITYEVLENKKENYNKDLGNLYSFDEQKVILTSNADSMDIEKQSLFDYINVDDVSAEIDEFFKKGISISKEKVSQFASDAKQSLINILEQKKKDGLKELAGNDLSKLIKDIKNYDPLDIIEITDDGRVLIDIEDSTVIDKKDFVKWLVGIACFINIGGCIAFDLWLPFLAPVSGAISGASIEAFIQVVLEDYDFEDINWKKVAVSSIVGAAFAWFVPAAGSGAVGIVANAGGSEVAAKLAGYVTKALCSSFISGSASAAYALIDGKDEEEVLDAALLGAALGFLLSAIGSGLEEVGSKAMSTLKNTAATRWFSKASQYIEDHRVHLKNKKLEQILTPKSIHQAIKTAKEQGKFKDTLKNRIDRLISECHKDYKLVDADGHKLTKSDLIKNGGNCFIELKEGCSESVRTFWDEAGVKAIEVKNGFVDFSKVSIDSFKALVTGDRAKNMQEYYKQLVQEWNADSSKIPDIIKEELLKNGCELGALTKTNIQQALSDLSLTLHEGADNTVYIVSRAFHEPIKHYGGVAWAKAIEAANLGKGFFTNAKSTISSFIYGTLIPNIVGE